MDQTGKTTWKRWLTFWEVVLAFVIGIVLFVILNILSAGILLMFVAVGVGFVALAAIHYLLWGQEFSWLVLRQHRYLEAQSHAHVEPTHMDDFVVELNDSERTELLQILEHSLAEKTMDQKKTALRREMVEKLRMFGADFSVRV